MNLLLLTQNKLHKTWLCLRKNLLISICVLFCAKRAMFVALRKARGFHSANCAALCVRQEKKAFDVRRTHKQQQQQQKQQKRRSCIQNELPDPCNGRTHTHTHTIVQAALATHRQPHTLFCAYVRRLELQATKRENNISATTTTTTKALVTQ